MSNFGAPPPTTFPKCTTKPAEDCSPSLLPRPTGFCKRYARNIPANRINPDQKTGIRRKMILPPLSVALKDGSDIDDEVEEDFRQAQADCMNEYYGNQTPSAMPWSGVGRMRQADEDPATTLSKLIEQENEELESSKMYLEKAMFDEANVGRSYRDLADAFKSRFNHDENLLDSELEPELAAQLLQSEEQGANLKHIPPAALYGRLFPDDRSVPKIMITAASKRRRGVVIPVRAGLQQDDQLLDDVDAGIVDFYEISTHNKPKDSKPIPSPIKHEAEGDADQILGLASESNEVDDERKPFKYIVTHEPPLHGNYAQLRGSEPPIWFPGGRQDEKWGQVKDAPKGGVGDRQPCKQQMDRLYSPSNKLFGASITLAINTLLGFFTVNPGVPELQSIDEPNDALEKAWESMNPSQVASPYGNILLGK